MPQDPTAWAPKEEQSTSSCTRWVSSTNSPDGTGTSSSKSISTTSSHVTVPSPYFTLNRKFLPEFKNNFDKQSLENTTYSFEYDYDSIMHYGKYFFSKGKGKPTITPKTPGVKTLGQRKALSKGDCLKLNDLYGCFDKPRLRRKYYFLCQFMGI